MGYVVAVTFGIKAGQMDAFLPLMRSNAATSVEAEPGCRQFDICLDTETPDTVFLYEVYDDRAAFDAHLASARFRRFDAEVADMIASKAVTTYDTVHANPD